MENEIAYNSGSDCSTFLPTRRLYTAVRVSFSYLHPLLSFNYVSKTFLTIPIPDKRNALTYNLVCECWVRNQTESRADHSVWLEIHVVQIIAVSVHRLRDCTVTSMTWVRREKKFWMVNPLLLRMTSGQKQQEKIYPYIIIQKQNHSPRQFTSPFKLAITW